MAPVESPPRAWSDPRFEPVQFLGRGSGGVVYRVLDRETGEALALKTFAERDPESLYRLKQEFRACSGIRHRNLVELYELRVAADDCFFTMELVDGIDFIRYVRSGLAPAAGSMLGRFLSAARQLAQGVAALHSAGRLHRDIKPPNVLVDVSGRTVLLDFGFMVAFGGRTLTAERTDTTAGSLAYMAPELLWGEAPSPASDWYSVGVVLYEALAGALPFTGVPAIRTARAREQPPTPLALGAPVPALLRELIEALLAIEPAHRPGAEQVAHAIDTCSAEDRAAVLPAPLAEELPFVGREAELAALHGAAARLGDGTSSIVRICGPSGIGKSELVRRFLSEAERGDRVVALAGRCHPYEAVPYRAFDGLVDALSRYLVGLPDTEVAAVAPRHASALIPLFPVLGRVAALAPHQTDGDAGDAQEKRRRGFAALRELLANLGARNRLILWIDDVQWADVDSAALARELFAAVDPPCALLVLTYRSDDRQAAETFAALDRDGLDRRVPTRQLELAPLSEAESRQLAERFAAGRLSDVSTAVREAAGSPFFVGQLVRHLLTVPNDAAEGLSQVMASRLDSLGHHARTLLEVVAVAGRPIDPRVALTAASVPSASRREVITLQEERLLRLSATAGHAIEVYHDRIRDSVLATLSAGALRERHRTLAHTLVRDAEPDPQALYRHFLGAGETGPAADWATEAADRADRAFAFAEAAELYRGAAVLYDSTSPRHWALQERRATALANAGRGGEAAPLFLAAGEHVAEGARLDLRRRAAEQYLQTGRLEEGKACLQALLRDVDLAYPRSTAGAALPTLARLAGIAVRGTRVRRAAESTLSRRQELRIASSRAAAKGLAMVDPFRGLYFAVRTLSLARRSGSPPLIARGLAEVGATLVPAGPPFAAWAARQLDRARQMAVELGDPYLCGLTAITLAQLRMVEGRWREMLALCEEGARTLTERCAGVSWEVALAHGAGERALEELGEIAELERRADEGARHAEQSGDMYRTVWALQNLTIARIMQGRIGEARATARLVRERWIPTEFNMQHLYMLRHEVYCDLADGDGENAWHRVDALWPSVVRANLLRHALLKTDALLVRARTALALATRVPDRRPKLLEAARSDARALERQGRPDTRAHAALIRAGAAVQQGTGGAAALLRDAMRLFDQEGMRAMHALAALRLAEVTGAPDLHRSRDALRRTGVGEVAIAVLAPGFSATA